MNIDDATTLVDVARAVCTAFHQAGATVVMTGGSAATYYAPEAYQSADIDFVIVRLQVTREAQVSASLAELGFDRRGDHYRHPTSPYPVEFPPGPLAVGGQIVSRWHTDRSQGLLLHVLTATDACKDRLAAFVHWNDRSGLAQALAVGRAARDRLDLDDIAAWAESEGAQSKYREFLRRLDDDGPVAGGGVSG